VAALTEAPAKSVTVVVAVEVVSPLEGAGPQVLEGVV